MTYTSSKGSLLFEVNSSRGPGCIENVACKDVAGVTIVGVEKAINWKRDLTAKILH